MQKNIREILEFATLFADKKTSHKAWSSLVSGSLTMEARPLQMRFDKEGQPLLESLIEQEAFELVKNQLKNEGIDRPPMQAEILVACNAIRSRYEANPVFLRDTSGAKPSDKVEIEETNPYEQLSDEELNLLLDRRKQNDNSEKQ